MWFLVWNEVVHLTIARMKRQENAKAFAAMQRMVGSFRQKPQLIACIEERCPNSLKQTRSSK